MASSFDVHRLAKRIAAALTRGKEPPFSRQLLEELEAQPESLFDTLDGITRNSRQEDKAREMLLEGYAYLMTIQLEALRYGVEIGDATRRKILDRFEQDVVSGMRAGEISNLAAAVISTAMRDARMQPGEALQAASAAHLSEDGIGTGAPTRMDDVERVLLAQIGDDPFALVDAFGKATHSQPAQLRAGIVGFLAASAEPVMRDSAALLAFDDTAEVRRSVSLALLQNASSISPASLRRLVTARNWVPEGERHLIDQVVRESRSRGIEMAAWPPAGNSDILASPVDGAGAQGFVAMSPVGKRSRMTSILVKDSVGIVEAWSTPPGSKRDFANSLAAASSEALMRPSSRDHLDRTIGHALALGLEQGRPPPIGLLQAAETLGAPDWRPNRIDWRMMLDELLAQMPPGSLTPAGVEAAVAASANWATTDGLAGSWFEEGPHVDAVLEAAGRPALEALIEIATLKLIEPRRAEWAEKLIRMALWLKSDAGPLDTSWTPFAILARELHGGRPALEVPLFLQMATTTILAAEARIAPRRPKRRRTGRA